MTTATRRRPASQSSKRARRGHSAHAARRIQNIVVATDGTKDDDSALRFAKAIADESVRVHVISACEPVPSPADWSPLGVMTVGDAAVTVDPVRERAARLAGVRAQMKRTVGSAKWPVRVTSGNIGPSIAALVHEAQGDLLLTGRGQHGLPERVLGEEHLLKVLRIVDVPILAVSRTLRARPKRIVVGVDFSEHSIDAARAALMLADDKATIHLVHVVPDPAMEIPYPHKWLRSYQDGAQRGLEEMHERLSPLSSLTVEHVALTGHPPIVLTNFARKVRADLIVTGAHGRGFMSRLVLGSVTAYLVREAPCSILAVPVR